MGNFIFYCNLTRKQRKNIIFGRPEAKNRFLKKSVLREHDHKKLVVEH
jgi:hypothetical protein